MRMNSDVRILYCECAYSAILPEPVKQYVARALDEAGLAYHSVPDLCELAARKAPLLAELAGASRLAIAACHPRAVKWLFAAGAAPLRDEGVEYLNLRESCSEQLLASIRDLAARGGTNGHSEPVAAPESLASGAPDWKPWFPVLDRSRCQNCQQCLGFCLFGVYGVGPEGKVEVQNPASCKTGCPACARVCPDAAIIFPKYANAPINGGEVKDGDPAAEPVQLDKAALVSGDVMSVLKERNKSGARFSPDPAQVKAVQERLTHLRQAQRAPDVMPGALTPKPPSGTEPS